MTSKQIIKPRKRSNSILTKEGEKPKGGGGYETNANVKQSKKATAKRRRVPSSTGTDTVADAAPIAATVKTETNVEEDVVTDDPAGEVDIDDTQQRHGKEHPNSSLVKEETDREAGCVMVKEETDREAGCVMVKETGRDMGCGMVLLSNLPIGFFEEQIFTFFKQFGRIGKIRLVRNPKTCTPRGRAYVQFKIKRVAEIVAETMNNYLLGSKVIKAVCLSDEEAADPRIYRGPRNFREWWTRRRRVTNQIKTHNGIDEVPSSLVLGMVRSEASFDERLVAAGVDPSHFTAPRVLGDDMAGSKTSDMISVLESRAAEEKESKLRLLKRLMKSSSPGAQRRQERKQKLKEMTKAKGKIEEDGGEQEAGDGDVQDVTPPNLANDSQEHNRRIASSDTTCDSNGGQQGKRKRAATHSDKKDGDDEDVTVASHRHDDTKTRIKKTSKRKQSTHTDDPQQIINTTKERKSGSTKKKEIKIINTPRR